MKKKIPLLPPDNQAIAGVPPETPRLVSSSRPRPPQRVFRVIREVTSKIALSAAGVWRRLRGPDALPALKRTAGNVNRFLSPDFLTLPGAAWGVPAMIVSSAAIIALETLLFHLLQIVTDYLTATSIIGLAMFGIALGGLVSFLLARVNLLVTTALAAAGLFVSIVFSYGAVIAVNGLAFPWPLILPFFFASLIVSNVYAAGLNANILNFANSIGAGIGALAPLVLVPALKSETALLALLLVPCLLLLLTALRTKNLLLKGAAAAVALVALVAALQAGIANRAVPGRIDAALFERKILPAATAAADENGLANRNWDFMKTAYKKNHDAYVFSGDETDRSRARALLAYTGFGERFPLAGLTFRAGTADLGDGSVIPAPVFEGELARAFRLRFRGPLDKDTDAAFLRKAFRKEGDEYRLEGTDYDRQRAKFLLGDLGFYPFYDLALDVRRHGGERDRMKMYNGDPRVLLSEDDLLGRLEYTGNEEGQAMAMNAVYLDSIDPYNGAYRDPRVPRVDFLKSPSVFVIGLSADGIIKSVKRLERSTTVGVELHPVVMRTMSEQGLFATLAHRPYDGVEAHQAEGRSFVENDPRFWDMISLMNIHPEHGPLNTVAPENLHTVEGVRALLDRLTDRGLLVYEEIVMNARSELAFQKFLNTCRAALGNAAHPERCFYVFRWDFWGAANNFRTLILRRTPLSKEEVKQLDGYFQALLPEYESAQIDYSPDRATGSEYERVILGKAPLAGERLPDNLRAQEFGDRILCRLDDPRDVEFLLSQYAWSGSAWFLKNASPPAADRTRIMGLMRRAGYPVGIDLSPVTDDRPFPYAVWREKTEILEIVNRVFLFALILALPVVVLFLRGIGARPRILLPAIVFTVLSGFAYMLVEIILLQRFQLFIGNPTWTLVVVLGGMLFFSGLGSLAGRFFPRWLVALASALIPALLFGYLLFLGGLFRSLAGLDFTGKLVASALIILPASFLQGIPFPAALETVKAHSSPAFTALLYGIAGGSSTVASAVALYINVASGFNASFTLGAVLYAAGCAFFLLLLFLTRKRAWA
jgi:hypothetical protein